MKVLSILAITTILTILSFNLSAQKVDIYGLPTKVHKNYDYKNQNVDNVRKISTVTETVNGKPTLCKVYQSGEIIYEIKIDSLSRVLTTVDGKKTNVTYFYGRDKDRYVRLTGLNTNFGIDSFFSVWVDVIDSNFNQIVNETGK